jgi:hypothetical protein
MTVGQKPLEIDIDLLWIDSDGRQANGDARPGKIAAGELLERLSGRP